MVNLFEYLNYREFLRDAYEERHKGDWRFSHRYIAERAGFDASMFNKILQGKRNLTARLVSVFADIFCNDAREKQLLAYDLLDADSGELLSHHEFEANKYPFMVHAEINALHYARGKVPPGSKLYVIGFPCERCALDVSLSGVAEVFVTKDDYDPKSTLNNSRDTAYYMFAQAGIVVTLCGKRIRPVVSKPQK